MTEAKFVPQSIREVMNPHTTANDRKVKVENQYFNNLRRLREQKSREESKLVVNPVWPSLESFTHQKLMRSAFQLIDFLEKNDIQFYGVGINASMKKADTPEMVIYVDRSTRSLVYAIDIPEVFQGIEVVTQVTKNKVF